MYDKLLREPSADTIVLTNCIADTILFVGHVPRLPSIKCHVKFISHLRESGIGFVAIRYMCYSKYFRDLVRWKFNQFQISNNVSLYGHF